MRDSSRVTWLVALALIASCSRQNTETSLRMAPPPDLPNGILAAPVIDPVSGEPALVRQEPHVDIDTHSRDEDVRPLLEFVARAGGYRLIYPANLDRRVRISLTNVPVSVALSTLLEVAGLTLESTTPGVQQAPTRAVVFYELPVNVDSLSAEAIVKRFGVSPAVAEMIVTSRGKP